MTYQPASPYLEKATRIAGIIPQVLENRGIAPLITRYMLAERDGRAWLFAVLDQGRIAKIERYTSPDLVHQISTASGGLPVVISNTTGLRYAVLLSDQAALPSDIAFPGCQVGKVLVGQSKAGQIGVTWPEFGNAVVAGMTRSGKSNFLRLVAFQALQEGCRLIVVDPDGSTFPNLAGHPQVMFYAQTPDGAGGAIVTAMDDYYKRVQTFTAAKERGQPTPMLPRLVVIIDEYNSLVMASGGQRAQFASDVVRLAYGGLKFGIHLILAGHEFTRDLVGPVAGQMVSRVCFSVRAPSISRLVVGKSGAEHIKQRGRALTDPWGWAQVYRLDFAEFEAMAQTRQSDRLTPQERALADVIKQAGGRATYEVLMGAGLTRAQADRLRADWLTRGLVKHDRAENNSLVLSEWV